MIAGADNAYEIILIREKVLSVPNFLIERTDFASLLDVLLTYLLTLLRCWASYWTTTIDCS